MSGSSLISHSGFLPTCDPSYPSPCRQVLRKVAKAAKDGSVETHHVVSDEEENIGLGQFDNPFIIDDLAELKPIDLHNCVRR